MITPINIALFGVVLAAVALVMMLRRRSGATHEAVSHETPDETMATVDEQAAPIEDDVFSKHVWSEAAATVTPVREDEAVSHELPDETMTMVDEPAAPIDDDVFSKHMWAEAAATVTPVREDEAADVADADLDAEDEDEPADAIQEADDEAEDDARDLDAPEGEHDEDTGEIQGLELEAMTDPDDGLGGIITEPGWYLPGEADMTRGSPGRQSGSLIPEDDFAMSGGLLDDEPSLVAEAPAALLAEGDDDFSTATDWAAPVENGAGPAEPSWLGLADEEGAAASALEDEISFEVAPSPSDDLFALPPLEEGIPEDQLDLGAPSLGLDRWQDPVTPSPSPALHGAAEITVAQHGPLTVSIDPAALVAIESEEIKRSTSHSDGAVSWELTLKVELRQRENGTGNTD